MTMQCTASSAFEEVSLGIMNIQGTNTLLTFSLHLRSPHGLDVEELRSLVAVAVIGESDHLLNTVI